MKKEVVNVRSQEEWDYVTEKLAYIWSAVSYSAFEEDSCILLNESAFGKLVYFKENNYTIISFEEFKSRYEPSEKVINLLKEFSANLNKMIEYTLDYGRDNIFKDLKELNTNKIQPIEELVEEANQILKKQKEMKEVNLTIEQAKEFIPKDKWKEFGIEEEIVLKDWEELDFENTFYLDYYGKIHKQDCKSDTISLNVPTEKHAKSMLAFAKLSMLMADLGDECNVDWNNEHQTKFTIAASKNELFHDYEYTKKTFLAFKTGKIRDAFFNKHQQLIKDYFML